MTAEEKEQADLDAKQALVTQLEEVNGIAFALFILFGIQSLFSFFRLSLLGFYIYLKPLLILNFRITDLMT